jgi:hypothetical protein
MRFAVGMSGDVATAMRQHLIRSDGQEDVLAATYIVSTGQNRTSMLINGVIRPQPGERLVRGTAAFTGAYVLRAATEAKTKGLGLVLLHSHPGGSGWQGLSNPDHDTESEYERVARTITKMPLVGMTLAGDDSYSARIWFDKSGPTWCESVRQVSDRLTITWNDNKRPALRPTAAQVRTVSSWGRAAQASIARMRVLVVGVGSVGLDVAQRLAATGLTEVGVMDFDDVETKNLDRMIGATPLDVALRRSKVAVAGRLMRRSSTASQFRPVLHESSITDPEGHAAALDYDVIVSCVDRPWARAVLNQMAYSDLIPVIDGGIAIDTFDDGRMRNAIWRTHTLVPGRPCMVCMGQLRLDDVTLDRQGRLDDPIYIAGSNRDPASHQNVAALSASVSAGVLAQFVSLVAHPAGRGVPAPLRYILSAHMLEHSAAISGQFCPYESGGVVGDNRPTITAHQGAWRETVGARARHHAAVRLRLLGWLESMVDAGTQRLRRQA